MSTPSYIVQSGDTLLVPVQGLAQLTIEWQQNILDKKASYHTAFVRVKGKVGDNYELKVGDKSRYGQKNAKGEARFIVYHDTSRNPYQHRFMNQALRANVLGLGEKVARMLGVTGGIVSVAIHEVQALMGDPLRKF
ncbi:hypothetical protein FRC07_009208 [Ceratobasidium sp. 392]|nr:hypothetical protein FRC07_009208 [Ceratobasidium sp. 392]